MNTDHKKEDGRVRRTGAVDKELKKTGIDKAMGVW